MQTTNELRRQASKTGFLLTAVLLPALLLIGAAAHAQSSGNSTAEDAEQTTRKIVVSIPDRKLALIQDGEVKKVFPVAVGKDSTPSPSGSFRIVNRVTKPAYYHEGKVIAGGPVNPLGTRWMGLSEHGYGIHGTNVPSSIGKAASHGCIRMARTDLEQLFELVKVGDAVEIRAERDEETARLFGATNTLLAEAGNDRQTGAP
jgi:lipoprotein-anchoring transpeptidase ErfK/SrfK